MKLLRKLQVHNKPEWKLKCFSTTWIVFCKLLQKFCITEIQKYGKSIIWVYGLHATMHSFLFLSMPLGCPHPWVYICSASELSEAPNPPDITVNHRLKPHWRHVPNIPALPKRESGALLFGTIQIASALHPKQTPEWPSKLTAKHWTGQFCNPLPEFSNSVELKVATIKMQNFDFAIDHDGEDQEGVVKGSSSTRSRWCQRWFGIVQRRHSESISGRTLRFELAGTSSKSREETCGWSEGGHKVRWRGRRRG